MQLNRVPWEEITICNSSSTFCTWSEMSPQNITTALDTSVRSVIGFVASLWYIASYWIRSIFRKPIPAKKSHRFYMFFVSFQWEEQPQCLMDDSLQIIFLILMISKRKTKFMCSLTHTPHLQQPTQIKHIASEPPCREIAFVFHFCSSVCLERTVLLYNQGCQWMAVILCIKTATWDTVKEVERF